MEDTSFEEIMREPAFLYSLNSLFKCFRIDLHDYSGEQATVAGGVREKSSRGGIGDEGAGTL